MNTEAAMELLSSELPQIVEAVFGTMLELEAEQSFEAWSPDPNRLTAAVHTAGIWNGAVLLECDGGVASQFAERFLSLHTQESGEDVACDLLQELVNMIGGNLKCVLAQGIRLSTPVVCQGGSYIAQMPSATLQDRMAFKTDGGPFWVTVLNSEPAA
jgi:CheY-specific phosphatase CheX